MRNFEESLKNNEKVIMLNEEEVKNNNEETNAYTAWLNNLANGRKMLDELELGEIYEIILKVAKISFARTNKYIEYTYEDSANIIFKDFLARDYCKKYSCSTQISEEYPYLDTACSPYAYKWVHREEQKGFNRMFSQSMTIKHFSNLMFTEFRHHFAYNLRNNKFKQRVNNTISIDRDSEEDTLLTIEKIEDPNTRTQLSQVEDNVDLDIICNLTNNSDIIFSEYQIALGEDKLDLTINNLMRLYASLADGKKLTTSDINEHIIIKDGVEIKPIVTSSRVISSEEVKYKNVYQATLAMKKYLLENGIVSTSKRIENGKEKTHYAFA